jgi:hypothetical protein
MGGTAFQVSRVNADKHRDNGKTEAAKQVSDNFMK